MLIDSFTFMEQFQTVYLYIYIYIYKDTAPVSDNVKASGGLDFLCHTKQECQILIKLNCIFSAVPVIIYH